MSRSPAPCCCDTLRAERDLARSRLDVDARRLADEVDVLVRERVVDARSPVADALLDFREPPSSRRSDRMVALQDALRRVRGLASRQRAALDFAAVSAPPGGCAERVEEAHRVLDEVEVVVRGVLP